MTSPGASPPAGAAEVASPAPRSRARAARLAALGVLALVVVWCAAGVWTLYQARGDALAGLRQIRSARDALSAEALSRDDADADLRDAGADFRRARERVRSLPVAALRILPVLGRQVKAFEALAAGAKVVVDTGLDGIIRARRLLNAESDPGEGRVADMREIGGIARDSLRRLREVDLGSGKALIPPLASARNGFVEQFEELRGLLERTEAVTAGLAEFLEGPTHYVVFAANNAEMRAGSGMFLSAGLLAAEGGRLSLSAMTTVEDLLLPRGAVPLPAETAALWGWTAPESEWRSLGTSPRFDQTAALAARMWTAKTGQAVDGVLAVDALAMQAVLAATGGVGVDGRTVDAASVVRFLLLDQYAGAGADSPERQARRDRLSAIAVAVMAALDSGGWDPATLAREWGGAARGRHLLAWSRRQKEQGAWRAAGVSGEMGPDSLAVAVLNRGGNKLDQFLEVDADLEMRRTRRGTAVALRVRLHNATPGGLPAYVAGPHPRSGVGEGVYAGIVAVTLPGATTGTVVDGAQTVAEGPDGPTRVIAATVQVGRDETRELVVRFDLPASTRRMDVAASARVPPVLWHVGDEQWRDDRARSVRW